MAFKNQNTGSVSPFPNQQDDSWKSQGFINFFLPTNEGKRRKLGSIGLQEKRPAEAQLLKWLTEDPSRVTQLLDMVEIDFQLAEGSEKSNFALPGQEEAVSAEDTADTQTAAAE